MLETGRLNVLSDESQLLEKADLPHTLVVLRDKS